MNCKLGFHSMPFLRGLTQVEDTGCLSWPFMASFRRTTTNDFEATLTWCFATSEAHMTPIRIHIITEDHRELPYSQQLITLHMLCWCHGITVARKASVESDEMLQSRPSRLCACLIEGGVKQIFEAADPARKTFKFRSKQINCNRGYP